MSLIIYKCCNMYCILAQTAPHIGKPDKPLVPANAFTA